MGVPAPDAHRGSNGFAFDRLGVRVPTVAVSPWIAKGTVVSAPSPAQAPTPTSWWDATSAISTVNRIFGIAEHLTARDAWAAHFEDILLELPAARKDCPVTLPPVAPLPPAQVAAEMATPLNDHHLDSLNLLCHLAAAAHPVCARHAGPREAFMAQLQPFAEVTPFDFCPVTQYPELHFPAARRLRQQHFAELSAHLFATYKAKVGVPAA